MCLRFQKQDEKIIPLKKNIKIRTQEDQDMYDYISWSTDHYFNETDFDINGMLNLEKNTFKKTGLIAKILEDNFNIVYEENKEMIDKYKPNAPKEIQKIIDCMNHNLGTSVYECPSCHEVYFVNHTCKSRMCSSCGYKYKIQRVENILSTVHNVKHRQIVFTIPEELRGFFFRNFIPCMNILFEAVNKTIKSLANYTYRKDKKTKKWKEYKCKIKATPAFIAFLHTFGRSLNFNPHIHILIAELKYLANGNVQQWSYFNYDALSIRFKNILFRLLQKKFGDRIKKILNPLYAKTKNGLYVNAADREYKSIQAGIEYCARYCGRIPISENRIENYDGQNVTFWYDDHKTRERITTTVTAKEFTLMIIRQIIPSQYKIIRYYGAYSKKHKASKKVAKLISKYISMCRKKKTKYRELIMSSFNRDPLKCPKCNKDLVFLHRFLN